MDKYYIRSILLIFLPVIILAKYENINFDHLTVSDGLPSNRVHCILQDSRGFMWFGTEYGLNKYDGYKFITYKPDIQNPDRIGNNFIWSILEDYNGNIWIGTYGNGLYKFDYEQEIFTNYKNETDDPYSLSNNYVSSICQIPSDSGKILWVGTRWGGLNIFDLKTKKFYNRQTNHWNFSDINTNYIYTMFVDREGLLWIGTSASGLIQYDLKTESFISYTQNPKDKQSLSNNNVRSIFQDKSGELWIGTYNGLNRFDRNQKKFYHYISKPHDKNSLSDNSVISIIQDKSDKLWIGTFNGLNIFYPETGKFIRIHSDDTRENGLSNDFITTIYQDISGTLWFGTLGGGIDKYTPITNRFKKYRIGSNNYAKTNKNSVRSIQEDITDENVLWIGTDGAGLVKYNRSNGAYLHYFYKNTPIFVRSIYQNLHIPNSIWIATWGQGLIKIDKTYDYIYKQIYQSQYPYKIVPDHISIIHEIKDGIALLGTSRGLYQFDIRKEEYLYYSDDPDNPNDIGHKNVKSIFKDKSGCLWIGTYGEGLYRLKLKSDLNRKDMNRNSWEFVHFENDPNDYNSISSNKIMSIYEAENNIIWIGTQGGGLNKLACIESDDIDQSTAKFIHFQEKDGLPSDIIVGILEDEHGNLWLSTNNGISKFDPVQESFRNFDIEDGLQGNEFNRFSCFKDKNGNMYFGGTNGYNVFQPDSIDENPVIPSIVITDFKIFNKAITPETNSPLKKSISETKEIILTHLQSVFSFEFAALEYTNSGKNKYAYKMEGVDPDWVYTDASRRFATYTQLDPGEYIFKVKGSNNDGIWNEEGTSIHIIIIPPWWQTVWAYAFYALFILSMVYGTWRFQINRFKLKRQLELEHQQAQKLEEIDKIKSHFFTNVSHEFRTPLTLIKGPSKLILENTTEEQTEENAKLIFRNSEKLSKLVNQLLDISKIEAGATQLKASGINIVILLKELCCSFAAYAETKKIKLNFNSTEQTIIVYLDIDKFEKIINNILSNALKYTAEHGEITVSVNESENFVNIKITDTGIGIPEDMLPYIFDRFYQAGQNQNHDAQGSGIGLALTKELVKLHSGNIVVDSKEGEGTTFTISFPLGKKHLQPDQIIDIAVIIDKSDSELTFDESKSTEPKKQSIEIENILHENERPLILIVEDNEDVRQYIKNYLKDYFQIVEAIDGEDGFKKSIEHLPEIIVSDVMMPNMDGFQLTDKLKNDQRTSHIPVILLTAKAASQDKMEGYEYGADDYIMKPFDVQELTVRIKNLTDQRKRLRQHFQKEALFSLENKEIPSVDKIFLDRAINVINRHLSDASFGVDLFASELAINRVTLYKKTMCLVGEPPGELIKRIRLTNAANLLKNKTGNISEIALEVGFTNPAYFSECFKKQFGTVPSKYYKLF